MRPLFNPSMNKKELEQSPESKALWDLTKRSGGIEYSDELQVLKLTEKEAEKCRFELTDMNNRLAECTVHRGNFSHGVRLFPPHLWNIKDGKVYYKHGDQWIQWVANIAKNKERLKDSDE